jgi:uncharacterized membrane protein (DUF373 family)
MRPAVSPTASPSYQFACPTHETFGTEKFTPNHPCHLAGAGEAETCMTLLDSLKKRRGFYHLYEQFEVIVSGILLVFISSIIIYSLAVLAVTLFDEFSTGVHPVEATGLKDTFGLILFILILIEFNHSVALSMRRRSGVLQVRIIILITIVVIARKLILLDYAKTTLETLFGFGGLALSLGVLYWLLSNAARRFAPETAEAERDLV